ncbi:VOC family protein [Streptomyces sp. NPDC050448]|uniref:VOC family protein n=1 Tax=Streptomyces sp. NPDC050448 TaxID=3155404 RepID=UPI0034480522
MDALHPRLLVARFGETFRFYDALLPALLGATRTRGAEQGPYASWDVNGQGVLALFDRTAMAATVASRNPVGPDGPATSAGPAGPDGPAGLAGLAGLAGSDGLAGPDERTMLVSRVPDVDAAYAACLARGTTPAGPPADRPEWGPTLRSAHVRDPEGNLWELQSY